MGDVTREAPSARQLPIAFSAAVASAHQSENGASVHRRIEGDRETATIRDRALAALDLGRRLGAPGPHGVEHRCIRGYPHALRVHEDEHRSRHGARTMRRAESGGVTGWGREERYPVRASRSATLVVSTLCALRASATPSPVLTMNSFIPTV